MKVEGDISPILQQEPEEEKKLQSELNEIPSLKLQIEKPQVKETKD